MKKYLFLLVLFPLISVGQIEKSLQLKIGVLKNLSEQGEKGEESFWQTKGKITFAIVKYTDAQNPLFRDLFIKQYREILPVFLKMSTTQSESASAQFVKIIIRHEEDYRDLLTDQQLDLYRAKLSELETKDPKLSDSYSAFYFSDELLQLYKFKFK